MKYTKNVFLGAVSHECHLKWTTTHAYKMQNPPWSQSWRHCIFFDMCIWSKSGTPPSEIGFRIWNSPIKDFRVWSASLNVDYNIRNSVFLKVGFKIRDTLLQVCLKILNCPLKEDFKIQSVPPWKWVYNMKYPLNQVSYLEGTPKCRFQNLK